MNDLLLYYWWLVAIVLIIEMILKGLALWKAGRNGQKWWFVCMFVLNTAGIIPLVYLLFFSDKKAAA